VSALDRAGLEASLRARPRRWLVTGGAGFIGSHLVARLVELGQEVRVLDNLSTGRAGNLAGLERVTLTEGDVCRAEDVEALLPGVEVVLHQAGRGSVPRSLADPTGTLAVNARGTWTVLAAARRAGVRRVVYASSSSVYGDVPELPWSEARLGRPLSPYAVSKRIAELAAEGLRRAGDLETVGLRYFNVFGPRQDPAGPHAAVVPRWCGALADGRVPTIHGDGTITRDLTPVAQVVEANLRAALVPLSGLPAGAEAICNVGTGVETSLDELARSLAEAFAGRRGGGSDRPPVHVSERPGDRRRSRADVARMRAWLGLSPQPALPALEALVGSFLASPTPAPGR
jgi:UDP-N-acetylglucosamine 4-epimerase